MSNIPFTIHDFFTIIAALLFVALICIAAIQMKRLGKPDERSTPIRTYMLATIFVSFIVFSLIMWLLLLESLNAYTYVMFIPAILSLITGIIAKKYYDKYHIL